MVGCLKPSRTSVGCTLRVINDDTLVCRPLKTELGNMKNLSHDLPSSAVNLDSKVAEDWLVRASGPYLTLISAFALE